MFSGSAFLSRAARPSSAAPYRLRSAAFAKGGLPLGGGRGRCPTLRWSRFSCLLVWVLLEQTIAGRGSTPSAAMRKPRGWRVFACRCCACGLRPHRASARRWRASCMQAASPRPIPRRARPDARCAIAAVFLGMTMSGEGEPRVMPRCRGVDPGRARQRPDADERRQLRARNPHRLDRHSGGGGQQSWQADRLGPPGHSMPSSRGR